MSSPFIRFETQIPVYSDGTSQAQAVTTFLTNMESICTNIYTYQLNVNSSGGQTQEINYFGYITSAQASTALGYLATLNTALGLTLPCYSWSVNSQP